MHPPRRASCMLLSSPRTHRPPAPGTSVWRRPWARSRGLPPISACRGSTMRLVGLEVKWKVNAWAWRLILLEPPRIAFQDASSLLPAALMHCNLPEFHDK